MKPKMRLACYLLLGAFPLAGIGADYGGASGDTAGSPAAASTDVSSQFNALDTNGDGIISRSEAQVSRDLNVRFDQMDSNRDGQLSLSEMQAGQSNTGAAGVSGSSRTDTPAPADTSTNKPQVP